MLVETVISAKFIEHRVEPYGVRGDVHGAAIAVEDWIALAPRGAPIDLVDDVIGVFVDVFLDLVKVGVVVD